MEENNTSEREVTYHVGGWPKQANDVDVILDPENMVVYTFASIGAGTPVAVWNHCHRRLATVATAVVPEALEEKLRGLEDVIRNIAALYTGTEWDGRNHIGQWSDRQPQHDDGEEYGYSEPEEPEHFDLDDVATYWDASEWVHGDPRSTIDEALEHTSLKDAAAALVESASKEGAVIDSNDAESAIRELLENYVEETREVAEVVRAARLLGQTSCVFSVGASDYEDEDNSLAAAATDVLGEIDGLGVESGQVTAAWADDERDEIAVTITL